MLNTLLVGSKSKSRERLIKESGINFKIVEQDFSENDIPWNLPLENLVKTIALHKMDHVILPLGKKINEHCFVVTADTLGIDSENNICGKPKDKQDAIKKIKSYRNGAQTTTAFCLDKKIWKQNKWEIENRIVKFASAKYIFDVPDNWIDKYIDLSKNSDIDYLKISGAVAIEEFEAQFLKYIQGSYTAVMGLPMYELREALFEIGFFDKF